MRRSPPLWYRALIGLWGLWFTVVLTVPAVLPPCPTHGGHAAHSAHVSHIAHDAAMPMPDTHRARPSSDRHQTSSACTCLGLCCCAGPAALPSVQQDVHAPAVPHDVATLPRTADAPRQLWAHAHPFATAPPPHAEA